MEYSLTIDDFKLTEKKIEAISTWIDPDFLEEQKKLGNYKESTEKSNVLRTYSTNIQVNASITEISFNKDDIDDLESFVQSINKHLNWISNNIDKIKNHITSKLLKFKNKSWLHENETKFSSDEFFSKLDKIESIVFNSDKSFELYYNTKNLFWGHTIMAPISSKLKLMNPDIVG